MPLVYWVPGVIGSLASANLDAKYVVTGASNAVCGLLGAPCRVVITSESSLVQRKTLILQTNVFGWH